MTTDALSGRRVMPLVVIALLGALASVVVDPMLGLPIAGAALAGISYAGHPVAAIIVGLTVGALANTALYATVLLFAGESFAVRGLAAYAGLGAVSLMLVGPVTAALLKRRSALWTAASVALGLTAVRTAVLAVDAAAVGQGITAYVESTLTAMTLQLTVGEDVVARVAALWPSALLTVSGFTALFVVIGAGMMGERYGVTVRRVPPLAMLDLDARMTILPIAAIGVLAASKLQVGNASSFGIAGSNLLMVARAVFFVQGIAAFAGLAERAKVPRPARMIGFVILGATELVVPSASLTGLADIWLNLRRLPREGSASGPTGETGRQDLGTVHDRSADAERDSRNE